MHSCFHYLILSSQNTWVEILLLPFFIENIFRESLDIWKIAVKHCLDVKFINIAIMINQKSICQILPYLRILQKGDGL